MKSNYLGEFRTALEKAKARRNLGIGDEYSLTWGNITGHIEDNQDLVNFIENQWKYEYVSPYIQQEIKNVKQALDYALYYVSTYEANDQIVQDLSQQFNQLTQHVDDVQSQLQGQINQTNHTIENIESSVQTINQRISDINEALRNINVDANINSWIESNLEKSSTIYFKDVLQPVIDDQGQPALDEHGEPLMEVAFQVIEIRISAEEGNAIEVKQDGIYVKGYDQDIVDINQVIAELQERMSNLEEALPSLKYTTSLPDATTSPVHEGVTVQQLKNKTMSEILDQVLFPAEVRELIQPTIEYSDITTLLEKGSPIVYPEVEYLAGDAGETVASSNTIMFGGSSFEGDYYDEVGTYIFTAIVQYDAGEYLRNNRGELTTQRVEAGAVSTTKSVKVTYPWYAGNEDGVTKQELVPIGEQSGILDFSLSKHGVIKIPGQNSSIHSFRLDSGLGYLDVDMDGWVYSTEQINGITYKVYTKADGYAAILPHRINFTINI